MRAVLLKCSCRGDAYHCTAVVCCSGLHIYSSSCSGVYVYDALVCTECDVLLHCIATLQRQEGVRTARNHLEGLRGEVAAELAERREDETARKRRAQERREEKR
jgi:hypothetical protein